MSDDLALPRCMENLGKAHADLTIAETKIKQLETELAELKSMPLPEEVENTRQQMIDFARDEAEQNGFRPEDSGAWEWADMLEKLWRDKEHQTRVYSENTSRLSEEIEKLARERDHKHDLLVAEAKRADELARRCAELEGAITAYMVMEDFSFADDVVEMFLEEHSPVEARTMNAESSEGE